MHRGGARNHALAYPVTSPVSPVCHTVRLSVMYWSWRVRSGSLQLRIVLEDLAAPHWDGRLETVKLSRAAAPPSPSPPSRPIVGHLSPSLRLRE